MARRRLPGFAFEYIDGGAEDETTLRWNRTALEAIRLVPWTLVDTRERQQRTELFGRASASPLVIAPTGLNGMAWPRGDIALARAAAAAGVPFTLSTMSNARLEDVAEQAGGRLWFQLYVMRDFRVSIDLAGRAERAGYEALVLTSDANVFGHREWDRRNYRAPAKLTVRNMLDAVLHARWFVGVLLRRGIPVFENVAAYLPPEARSATGGVTVIPAMFAPTVSWDDLARLRDLWPRKLVVKGVLRVEDAEKAAALGCDGIVISNHGGRQLDGCVSPVEVLPAIARAVAGRMTVIVDSGFRRGTDVVKALALGAGAVMLGRATLYGLAAGGEAGARHALRLVTTEIDRVLGQLACRSLADVGPGLIAPGPASAPSVD
jgi:(S)-mandelate dehydrogenase